MDKQQIKIEKIVLNVGAGANAELLEKACTLLERLTNQKPVKTVAKKRIAGWKIRPGLPIGAKVTIRGQKAIELLKRLFKAIGNELPANAFGQNGFSFGIKEYIDVPGLKYDPKLGIFGFDVCVSLARPGYRVKYRKIKKAKVGKNAIVTAEDGMKFVQEKFGVKIK